MSNSDFHIVYTSSKDDLVMDDVFLIYNPKTNDSIAAFDFEGVIYVAIHNKDTYYLNMAKPTTIKENQINEFISNQEKNGYKLIFNTITKTYNDYGNYNKDFVRDNIVLTHSGIDINDRLLFTFRYRNVDDLIVTQGTEDQAKNFKKTLNFKDMRIPEKPYDISYTEIKEKLEHITEQFERSSVKDKIEVSLMHFYFQSIRAAFHYAVTNNHVDLLAFIHANYALKTVEPVASFIVLKLMTHSEASIQSYFLKNIPYDDFPWNEEMDLRILKAMTGVSDLKKLVVSSEGKNLFQRYFEDHSIL